MVDITITLDNAITIPLGRNSAYGTVEVLPAQFPVNSLEFIWGYGLRQILNDARATTTDKDGNDLTADEIRQKVLDKLTALYAGELRVRGESIAADAYEAEAIREAKRHIMSELSKNGLMKDIPKDTKNRLMYAINRIREKAGQPEISEGAYMESFLSTKVGKAIRVRARETVDRRRAESSNIEDLGII